MKVSEGCGVALQSWRIEKLVGILDTLANALAKNPTSSLKFSESAIAAKFVILGRHSRDRCTSTDQLFSILRLTYIRLHLAMSR